MTKEMDLRSGIVPHTENTNHRYAYTNHEDPWKSYHENPMPITSKPRMKLNSDDEAVLSFFCDHYSKGPKDLKITASSRTVGVYEQNKRGCNGLGNNIPELTPTTYEMKFLAENISSNLNGLDSVLTAHKPDRPCGTAFPIKQDNEDFLTPATETYDKNMLSSIFDSILLPQPHKWTLDSTFKGSHEHVSCDDPFTDQTEPAYSDSYPRSVPARSDFEYLLGCPRASLAKSGEIPMAYLNKGQFYPIFLKATGGNKGLGLSSTKVKTVVMAVFENEKNAETQLKCWNHWHSRQPTAKQRVIDIADYKEVYSTVSNIEEVAFNALSFTWNTNDEAKVYIGINCLSTDFSSQKGVKGLPLNLQIDTYDYGTGTNRLIHRAACQIKVFCDKGAERKMRDEERKQVRRKGKGADSSNNGSSVKQSATSSPSQTEFTCFQSLDDLVTQPVLFIPEIHYSNMQRCGLVPPAVPEDIDRPLLKRSSVSYTDNSSSPPLKQSRIEERQQRVLLYVRTESEEVFDALMLNTPDMKGLRDAISEKYGLPEETISKIYKKCKRGIFVNMDDNIIQHYCNHAAFLLDITEMMGRYQITLREL
ncbi:grainyhead-like protein 3 homolog isoform X1 [Erpetoichthys calabaricus]|uniref:grainyhead-like protein 3 homolog isoform X1 n=1 Tax=Erpetoichthys calabaricus TaxID=27687 RepID=UPI002234A250|nr:grainyhead-like protein 3 homolog isoform X1 [Erpetoichthys calabaricus]